jgi:hypothetical protein
MNSKGLVERNTIERGGQCGVAIMQVACICESLVCVRVCVLVLCVVIMQVLHTRVSLACMCA